MSSFFQFSIRNLLIAIAFIAVGITALVNANIWWEAGLWAIVFFLLGLAILFVIDRRDNTRAFWLGFLVFGSFYLSLFLLSKTFSQPRDIVAPLANLAYTVLLPESRKTEMLTDPNVPAGMVPPFSGGPPGFNPYATTMPGGMSGGSMPGYPMPMSGMMPGGLGSPGGGWGAPMVTNPKYVPLENFVQIFHALSLLIVAAIGGKAAQFISRKRPLAAPVPPAPA